jgi:hypothetical protein
MRINYTRYDVRRDEDVIHIGTSRHCNIMMLNPRYTPGSSVPGDSHPFCYARVLGIFHANVMYVGAGNTDYRPRRLEVLWVRWYKLESGYATWSARKLDRVSFLPVTDENAFGFLDPSDVLRGCHIIPAFRQGRVWEDGEPGLSYWANDVVDWKSYFISR